MKNKDLKKIEDKLSDIEVSDAVLDKARSEMQNFGVKQKSAPRFNYKILLSCAASLALCLAIILPISLSAFRNNDNKYSDSDNNQSDIPQAPGDISSIPPTFTLEELDKVIIYGAVMDNETGSNEPMPPSAEDPIIDTEIVYRFHYKYSFEELDIISEEKYSVGDAACVVYTLYDLRFQVDVLEEFTQLNNEYSVENIKFNYRIASNYYLADTVYGQISYSFKLKSTDQSVFEAFCKYLSEKILK